MQGITNCMAGGGATHVWAVNNTGGNRTAGDKIWLNRQMDFHEEDCWIANTYEQISEQTLTGFATGRTDEKGMIEVKTVLPETTTYTVSFIPDEDTFTFRGEAK